MISSVSDERYSETAETDLLLTMKGSHTMADRSARQSNVELLRIFAACGVIILHYNNPLLGGGFDLVTDIGAEECIRYRNNGLSEDPITKPRLHIFYDAQPRSILSHDNSGDIFHIIFTRYIRIGKHKR